MDLPFDGAISTFYEQKAPQDVRSAIETADKSDILSPSLFDATANSLEAFLLYLTTTCLSSAGSISILASMSVNVSASDD